MNHYDADEYFETIDEESYAWLCVCVWVAVMAVLRAECHKTLLAVCNRGIRR